MAGSGSLSRRNSPLRFSTTKLDSATRAKRFRVVEFSVCRCVPIRDITFASTFLLPGGLALSLLSFDFLFLFQNFHCLIARFRAPFDFVSESQKQSLVVVRLQFEASCFPNPKDIPAKLPPCARDWLGLTPPVSLAFRNRCFSVITTGIYNDTVMAVKYRSFRYLLRKSCQVEASHNVLRI